MPHSDSLRAKWVVSGQLRLESPLMIGSGERSNDVDLLVLKDAQGCPYIPATALAGSLRHHFFREADFSGVDSEQIRFFWGMDGVDSQDRFCQSAILFRDLVTRDRPVIRVRDGVKLNNDYGMAEDRKKYDYEVVEPGIAFDLRWEITLRGAHDGEVFRKIVAFLIDELRKGQLILGAMTTKGFGRCRLSDVQVTEYDFSKPTDVLAWLDRAEGSSKHEESTVAAWNGFAKKNEVFRVQADFAVKNSLIIRSYSGDPQAPDAVHITSAGKEILPGTSLKGALRGRAERIIRTLGGDETILHSLFGFVDETSGKKKKSRLVVEETPIQNGTLEVQNRIRVDRFTGGVMNAALFDAMPIWPKADGEPMVRIEWTVRQSADWERGLLMLLLKDLWTGDLPLGGEKNIGRGVLTGLQVEIQWGAQKIIIRAGSQGNLELLGDAKAMEDWVQALVNKCGMGVQKNA